MKTKLKETVDIRQQREGNKRIESSKENDEIKQVKKNMNIRK